jgi:filamentous hemagglutinin family protein
MLEDLNSTFRLNVPPYTRYVSTGAALVTGGGGGPPGPPPFSSFTVNTVVANAIDAPAGTTWIVCNDAVNEVQDITIDGMIPPDGYDLVIAFPNGTALFAGQAVSATGNATLTTVNGEWTVIVRVG